MLCVACMLLFQNAHLLPNQLSNYKTSYKICWFKFLNLFQFLSFLYCTEVIYLNLYQSIISILYLSNIGCYIVNLPYLQND